MRAVRYEKFQCVAITVRAKTADNCLRHVAEIGMFTEGFASMRIRKMHFHEWNPNCGQGIPQGDTGVGEGGRVNQDKTGAVQARGLNAIHQLVFGIGLEAVQLMPNLGSALAKPAIDLLECRAAIDARLAFSEVIQIGSF